MWILLFVFDTLPVRNAIHHPYFPICLSQYPVFPISFPASPPLIIFTSSNQQTHDNENLVRIYPSPCRRL